MIRGRLVIVLAFTATMIATGVFASPGLGDRAEGESATRGSERSGLARGGQMEGRAAGPVVDASSPRGVANDAWLSAQRLAAEGLSALSRGEREVAIIKLESAATLAPFSPAVARDLAVAYAAAGRWHEAEIRVGRAIAQGDDEPETHELLAIITARVGDDVRALSSAKRADTPDGELLSAALLDPTALHDMARTAGERSERGALAALVLSSVAARRSDASSARSLANIATTVARRIQATSIVAAAQDELRRLDDAGPAVGTVRVRSTLDHRTNPWLRADADPLRSDAVSARILASGATQLRVGPGTIAGGLLVAQEFGLAKTKGTDNLDRFMLDIGVGVYLPITEQADSPVVVLAGRFADVYQDRFRTHVGYVTEIGPRLALRVAPDSVLELGVVGLVADVVDLSPADAVVSSLNRDYFGQRAILALSVEREWIRSKLEAIFLRDDAKGEAFDAFGGQVSARASVHPTERVSLAASLSVGLREFGPVGDRAIIGPASTRTELRMAAELGGRVRFAPGLHLLIEDSWLNCTARSGHAYGDNRLSIGVEYEW